MSSAFESLNEMVRFDVAGRLAPEYESAFAEFFRLRGSAHVFDEMLRHVLSAGQALASVGVTDRPWPPIGIGSRRIEAIGIALIGKSGRAFLTPVQTSNENRTNIGLSASVTKRLAETLVEKKVARASYFVRPDAHAVTHALIQAGFAPSDQRLATEQHEYVEFAVKPEELLACLGLADMRLGDLLALKVEPPILERLTLYHLATEAAIAALGSRADTVILPGLIDWLATSPPGGIGGTPGPGVDVVIIGER